MLLSATTRLILSHFASINDHLVVDKGNVIRTVHPQGSFLLECTVEEEFDQDFAIANLAQFNKILSLFDEPDITFSTENITITDVSNGAVQTIGCCLDRDSLVYESRDVPWDDDGCYNISMRWEDFDKVVKSSSINNTEDICFFSEDDQCYIKSYNMSYNNLEYKLPLVGDAGNYQALFRHNKRSKDGHQLKLIPSDYEIKLSPSKISQWSGSISDGLGGFDTKIVAYVAMMVEAEFDESEVPF